MTAGATCPSCGTPAAPAARFCVFCGARLAAPEAVRSRYMTVLFCDLCDSVMLTERLGAETMFALIERFQDLCGEVVAESGGYVAKYMGDGMLAYFGYPHAMKNSAAAAVEAALTIFDRMGRLAPRNVRQLRGSAGVATGWAVVGERHAGSPAQEALAIGGAVNLAARLQAVAGPGRIAVSADAGRRLEAGRFTLQPLGARTLKGFDEPVEVWIASAAEDAGTPHAFVGRAAELSRLREEWAQARGGQARVVEIVAPGGYGKTALVRRFLQESAPEGGALELRCQRHRRDQSFACFRPLVAELAGATPGAPEAAQREALARWAPAEALEGLALLLVLDKAALAPAIRAGRIHHALKLVTTRAVARTPILVIEDAHWLDAASDSLLQELAAGLGRLPLLILCTRRPEGEPRLTAEAARLTLERLSLEEAAKALDAVDPERRLDAAARSKIVASAGGVPLFLDQIARAILERPEAAAGAGVPETLIEALFERFDHVGDAKPLVEAAAVLGAEVRVEVLAAMLGRDPADVSTQLTRLVGRSLFTPGGGGAVAFDHVLIRDAVLETLLSGQRAALHGRALQAYAEAAPGRLEAAPAQAAYHLLGARRPAEAIPKLIEAAREALGRGETAESERLLRRAEAALVDVADPALRENLEMRTQFELGLALVQTRGFADRAVGEAYDRALSLCLGRSGSGGGETEFQIAWGLWAHETVLGDAATALRTVERMEAIALANSELDVLAASARALTDCALARFESHEAAVERVTALYDFRAHRRHAFAYSMDSLELALLFRIHARWIVGDFEGWRAASAAAEAHGDRLGLPFVEPYIRVFGAAPRLYSGWDPEVRPRLEAAVAQAERLGQPFWMLNGALWLALERLRRSGPDAETLAGYERALKTLLGTGQRFCLSFHEAQLAHGQAMAGRHREAAATLAPAQEDVARGREAMYAPEVLRIAAETGLLRDPLATDAAEATLAKAAALARAQGARAWAAHVAGSRARLAARRIGAAAAAREHKRELAELGGAERRHHDAFRQAARALDRFAIAK